MAEMIEKGQFYLANYQSEADSHFRYEIIHISKIENGVTVFRYDIRREEIWRFNGVRDYIESNTDILIFPTFVGWKPL